MPSREAAQLGVSGLGSHVAVKRAGVERKEADWSTAARWGDATCAPSGDAGLPAGHHRGKHLSGLDRFRVRRRHSAHVQRSHRRTFSTKSDESEEGRLARDGGSLAGRFSSTRPCCCCCCETHNATCPLPKTACEQTCRPNSGQMVWSGVSVPFPCPAQHCPHITPSLTQHNHFSARVSQS
jgi:hypothetical protein